MQATMRAKAAAEYLGVSYWKLLEWARAGKIPHIRLDGRILFRRESLDRWLAELEATSVQRRSEQAQEKIRRLK